jgi:hypothetical protein
MKNASRITLALLLTGFLFFKAQAQEVAALSPAYTPAKAITAENPTAPVANTELTIMMKNGAERPVLYFAGPKEEVRKPRVQTIGGLGKTTLYVQTNDVVCLLNNDAKPTACTVLKPGTTSVEVNISATNISSK